MDKFNIDSSLLTFRKSASEQKASLTLKTNTVKRFFSKPSNIMLFVVWVFMFIASIVSLGFNSKPYEALNQFNLDQNIPAWYIYWQDPSYIYSLTYKPSDVVQQELLNNIFKKYDISYKIETQNVLIPQLQFSIFDLINKLVPGQKAILGTDNTGHDVLTYTLQLFFYSVLASIVMFSIELIIGLSWGSFMARKNSYFTQVLIKFMGVIIALPDLIYVLIILILTNSIWWMLFTILITGIIRLAYWAYSYAVEEYKKDYILALKSLNVSPIRLVYNHIIPAIFGRIFILFARRIGYIIFLVATVSFMGYTVSWNIASIFQIDWPYRDRNIWQIVFPTVYLFIFLTVNQFLAIKIAKTIDLY